MINIAPREGLELRVLGKVPGAGVRIEPASLDLDNQEQGRPQGLGEPRVPGR